MKLINGDKKDEAEGLSWLAKNISDPVELTHDLIGKGMVRELNKANDKKRYVWDSENKEIVEIKLATQPLTERGKG